MSVLATPQIPAGGSRYVEKDGNTKEVDGEAGPPRGRGMSQVRKYWNNFLSVVYFLS